MNEETTNVSFKGETTMTENNVVINEKNEAVTSTNKKYYHKFYNKKRRPVIIKVLDNGTDIPEYKTPGAAGCDICSSEDVIIEPSKVSLIHTGLFMEIQKGYEVQVRPRSGLALKNSITVLNTPGTIDSDYRGELCVILINHGTESFKVSKGDRIAQLVVNKVTRAKWIKVSSLSDTERSDGGFGHTGVSK